MLLSLLVLATVPIQSTGLDLDFPGGTLTTLAKEIETQTGWNLHVHPDVANEVVVVYSKGRDTKDIVKQLAKVTATTWTLNGDEMTVVPDVALRQQQWESVQQLYVQKLIKARQDYLNSVKERIIKGDNGKEFVYKPKIEEKILSDLIAGISIESFAMLQPGGRLVLSSNPNRSQVALGRFNSQDFQDWVAQYNDFVSKVNNPTLGDSDNEDVDMRTLGGLISSKQEEIKEPIAKVLLVLSRSQNGGMFGGGGITCTAKVIGQSGKTLLKTSDMIGAGFYGATIEELRKLTGREVKEEVAPKNSSKPGDELEISWPEETKSIKNALQVDYSPKSTNLTIPKEIREILMRPDLYEPMKYELGNGLVAMAKVLKQPIIASLPDQLMQLPSQLPKTVRELRESFLTYNIIESVDDGWVLVTPSDPVATRTNRVSREALAQMLAVGQDRMFLPLDPIADFVYLHPNAANNSVAQTVLRIFAPQLFASMFGANTSMEHLRLYGSMVRGQRSALRAGSPMQVSQMGQATRLIVEQLVFGADAQIRPLNLEDGLQLMSLSKKLEAQMRVGLGDVVDEEPTEILPDGLPSGGLLTMKSHKTQYLVPVTEDGFPMKMNTPLGRTEISMWRMLSKDPRFLADLGNMTHVFKNMRAGNRNELKFVMFVTPTLGFGGQLQDFEEPDMSKKYSFFDLPPGLKEQVEADLVEVENSQFGKLMKMNGSGGRTIKP